MTKSLGERYASKRDLWLCLARAFAPPAGGDYHAAFVRDLPDDLTAISEEIRLNVVADLDGFAEAARQLPDALEIQRSYAALFVTPPTPVFMNTAIYLDGAFLGQSEIDLGVWYARHGYGRHAEFHDLNDHAAVQFEFVALLFDKAAKAALANDDMEALAYAAEAERFLNAYPKRWMTAFLQALAQAVSRDERGAAYLYLARIAWLAIEQAIAESPIRAETAGTAFPDGSSRGLGPLTADDLAEIALRLEAAGLDYTHVMAFPEWRDEALATRRERTSGDMACPRLR
jgi:TorA maturation chaperone TorD